MQKKKSVIASCLADYRADIVERPQINTAFGSEIMPASKSSLSDYARSSYQKVIKDLENLQKLIDQLSINEVRL